VVSFSPNFIFNISGLNEVPYVITFRFFATLLTLLSDAFLAFSMRKNGLFSVYGEWQAEVAFFERGVFS
jgi:hypothetical protein